MVALTANGRTGRLPVPVDDLTAIKRQLKTARRKRERAEQNAEAATRETAELIAKALELEPAPSMTELAKLAGVSRQTAYQLVRWLDNPDQARWGQP